LGSPTIEGDGTNLYMLFIIETLSAHRHFQQLRIRCVPGSRVKMLARRQGQAHSPIL
jgi:hypothetical protein